MAENLTNGAQTTLNGAINNSQTTATLTSASGWPAAPFRALISAEGGNTDEIIYVGAISGTSLTNITRAAEPIADGTQVAQAHSSGATITQVLTRVGLIDQGMSAGTIGAVVYPATNQAAGTGSYARLDIFNAELFDTDGFHSTSSNNGRFTIPVGLSGKYLIYLHTYNTGANGAFTAIYKNGVIQAYSGPMTSADTMTDITLVLDAVAGDYFEAYYSAGSTTWISQGTWFGLVKLDSGNVGTGVGAKAYNSGTQSIPNSTYTALTLDTESWDTDGFHSTSVNTSRMTIPAGLSGKYLVTASSQSASNGTGDRYITFFVNGVNVGPQAWSPGSAATTEPQTTGILNLLGGDYVEVCVFQNSGGSLNYGDATNAYVQTSFSIMRLDSLINGSLGRGIGAKAYNAGTQSISNNTLTVVTLNSEEFDTDGFHDTSTNTSRFTIPAGLSGTYLLNYGTNATTSSTWEVGFQKNGSTLLRGFSGGGSQFFSGSTVLELVAGDYIELVAFQTTGSSQPIGNASSPDAQTWASIMLIDSGSGPTSNVKETANFAIPPLDRTTVTGLNTTYGDDFTDSALNARWTRQTQGSGEESYQQGPRQSALEVAYSTGAASRYIYQALSATTWTFETSLSVYEPTSTGQMFGIMALDSSQNGVGVLLYDNSQGLYLGNIVSGSFSSTLSTIAYSVSEHRAGQRYWLRLRAAAGTFFASYSFDGEAYSPELSGTPSAFTIARIGIGRFLGTQSGDTAYWHWFDKTA